MGLSSTCEQISKNPKLMENKYKNKQRIRKIKENLLDCDEVDLVSNHTNVQVANSLKLFLNPMDNKTLKENKNLFTNFNSGGNIKFLGRYILQAEVKTVRTSLKSLKILLINL